MSVSQRYSQVIQLLLSFAAITDLNNIACLLSKIKWLLFQLFEHFLVLYLFWKKLLHFRRYWFCFGLLLYDFLLLLRHLIFAFVDGYLDCFLGTWLFRVHHQQLLLILIYCKTTSYITHCLFSDCSPNRVIKRLTCKSTLKAWFSYYLKNWSSSSLTALYNHKTLFSTPFFSPLTLNKHGSPEGPCPFFSSSFFLCQFVINILEGLSR